MLPVPVSVRFSTSAPRRVADRALHRVGALAGGLRDHVAGVVDHVDVVAGTADHGVVAGTAVQRVVAGAAVEHVVAGVAGEHVGERIAGGVDAAGAGQRQVLDVGAEAVADRALHRVGALAGGLRDHVAGGVDHIDVVADAADHGVVAGTAVEHVVAGVAGQRVGERVAGGVDAAVPVSVRFSTSVPRV